MASPDRDLHSRFQVLALLVLGAVVPAHTLQSRQLAPCEGPDSDSWVADVRDRVLAHDDFARFATRAYGAPRTCEGAVTGEFEGAKFGRVLLTFAEGVTLEVETAPPESSITTLRKSAGFENDAEVRRMLEQAARRHGLSIDWSTPETRSEGPEVVHQFWDPDPGLNGSASLLFRDGHLVGVRVAIAL